MSFNTLFYVAVIATICSARPSASASFNFTIEPSDHVVAIGQPLLLNCQAQYSGPESVVISWRNNGAWLLDPANKPWKQLANSSLYYSSIPAQSIGTFICGAAVTGTHLIIYSRTATVQRAYIKSQYLAHPVNVTKRLGEIATFDCTIEESLPYASIQWYKDGNLFTQGEVAGQFHIPGTKATSSALSVKSITFSSAGWYWCVAINPLLPSQPESSKRVYLTVLPSQDKPHFGVHPANMIVPEHLPAIMQCQILGVPPPIITWTMNGQSVSNVSDRYILSNGSLYFSAPVNRSYAGQYMCSGTNSAGSISSGTVFFRVAYFDFAFVENPSNKTVVVGDAISMNCIPPVSFPHQVTIHWYHNYQLITPGGGISVDSSGSIKFTAIRKSDEGMYFCDGTNSDLQATRTSELAYVTVRVPPTFQVQPRDINVTEGSPLTLHCQATGFPEPMLTWQKDSQPVDTNHVTLLSNGSLHISATVVQDAGRFSCVASNSAGSTTVSADVVIYVPPSLVTSAANATKTVGESVKFECSFNGIPKPNIHWFYMPFGGSRVQLTQTDHYVITAGSLEIKQILKKDEGMYICRAVNVAGSVESSVYLRVKVPASLDMHPVNMTVNESSSASFQCNASGDPKPVLTWFKGGTQLAAGGRIVIGGDSLTILNTVASDAGQYSCNVSNGLNSHVGIAHLLVQVAPDITSFLVPRLAQLGMNATLTCAVSGIPQPGITWYRDSVLLSVTSSVFVIDHVREADGGVYSCIASNPAGRKSKHGNLTVQVAPSAPLPISAIPESSTTIQLSWRPGFDGHNSITGYKLEIKGESGTYVVLEENILVTSYTVRNLDPYITYTFKISARNAVGLSPGATVANRTLEDAPSPPINLVAVSLNATAISITWSRPAEPNGQITRYEIQYNAVGSSDVTSDVLSANQIPGLKTLIGSLKPFTRYQIRIRAATGEIDVMWGNFSAGVEETTGEAAPDAPPQGIQLQVLSADSIFVKWKSVPSEFTNGNVKKYIIFVKAVGPYRFSEAKNFSTDTSLNFTIRQLFPWTIYNVSVQAFTVQAGPRSPWEQAQTLEAVPGPPSNVTLVSDSQQGIVVYIAQPLPLMRNGIIVGYTVFYRESNLLRDAGYLSINTTASSVALVNLTVFTEYSVKVAAFTNAGMGKESDVKTVVTQEGVPGTVDDVTVTVVDYDTITVTWRPPEKPNGRIIQYNVTYNTADENSTRSLSTDGDLTVDINNLTPNTTYYIFVTAKTSRGFGKPGKTVNATTSILPPPTAAPTEPQTTPPDESNTATVAIPAGTEKRTGGLGEDQLVIIIVCVGLIVLFLFIAAVYFLGCRRWREKNAEAYTKSKKRRDFRSGYEMDSAAYPGFSAGSAVLDVQEETSIADTNFSSDLYDSDDWNSSVASPSPVKMSREYSEPADRATPHASGHAPLANLRNKKASIASGDSQYDQPYSSVEELGGGFATFGPLPPVAFRSSPIEERDSESPGSRKSFTNELYNPAATEEGKVSVGEGTRVSKGYQNRDVSGVENKCYDSDEELDQRIGTSLAEKSTPSPVPPNLEELYAKVDKTKKKTFRRKEVPSLSETESNQSTTLNDSFAKPDKSKKTFRKVSSDPKRNQGSRRADGPSHEPVVVYDERTNFNAEAEAEDSHPAAEKHDAKSVGESTFSSDTITVSDLNSSEAAEPVKSEDLIDWNLELPQADDNEELSVQDPVPRSPSPFTLRNKKISLDSQGSFYDEPYTNLEEIDAGTTPVPDFTPAPPPTFGSTVDEAPPQGQPKVLDVAPTISRSSFPNEPYGVVDKMEEEDVVLEVKEIENDKEAESAIKDFDEVLNGLLGDECKTEPDERHNSFTSSSAYDSTVLMF